MVLTGAPTKRRLREESDDQDILNENRRLGIRQILHRLPRSLRNIVPDSIDKVPDLPPEDLGVQNFADLELREAIHVERRGDFLDSALWPGGLTPRQAPPATGV